jgi:hypothetical protein
MFLDESEYVQLQMLPPFATVGAQQGFSKFYVESMSDFDGNISVLNVRWSTSRTGLASLMHQRRVYTVTHSDMFAAV